MYACLGYEVDGLAKRRKISDQGNIGLIKLNPYIINKPIEPKSFIGRKKEIKIVEEILEKMQHGLYENAHISYCKRIPCGRTHVSRPRTGMPHGLITHFFDF